jgi:putative nucleotidyltransferase with HDIG domain
MFVPEHVEALMRLAPRESFWLDIVSPWLRDLLAPRTKFANIRPSAEKLLSLADMFRQMIDFRSRYTATHSAGVAAAAETLATLMGFSPEDCQTMRIAGYLHDLGKLSIPSEILEKPAALSLVETNLMRHHAYYGYRALQRVPYLDTVNAWASFHHERLDGQGYPFHLKADQLPPGSRIMAVADTFAALTEDRAYRRGMPPTAAREILGRMAASSGLDGAVVAVLGEHAEVIDAARARAFAAGQKEYEDFWAGQRGPARQSPR